MKIHFILLFFCLKLFTCTPRMYVSRYISYSPVGENGLTYDYHTIDYFEDNSILKTQVGYGSSSSNPFLLAVLGDNTTPPQTPFHYIQNNDLSTNYTLRKQFLPRLYLAHDNNYVAWDITPKIDCSRAENSGVRQYYRMKIKFFTCVESAQAFYSSNSGTNQIFYIRNSGGLIYNFPSFGSGSIGTLFNNNIYSIGALTIGCPP